MSRDEWLRMYGGMYYLNYKNDDTWGVRARVEGRVTKDINLNFMYTNDDKWGSNFNLGVEIRFDGTLPTRFGGQGGDSIPRMRGAVHR